MDEFQLDRRHARRSFDQAASSYDEAAVLQREIGDRLVDRLEYIRIEPKRVLDLGAGTGYVTGLLLDRYPGSEIWAMDFAPAMLQKVTCKRGWFRRPRRICADAGALPCRDASFDLVVSNLMLQWCLPLENYFAEIRRVLAADGLLMFSSFGPDTLKELRQAWAGVDDGWHVHEFVDMHDVGDALVATGFAGPVMDMEMITLTYRDLLGLMRDLKAIGAVNSSRERRRGLLGRQGYRRLCEAYERFRTAEHLLPASYEIIYGHAWVPDVPAPSVTKENVGFRIVAQK
jgi:malonyl-CoA O-methyltransferase